METKETPSRRCVDAFWAVPFLVVAAGMIGATVCRDFKDAAYPFFGSDTSFLE